MRLAIYCAGGLGREILELARGINGNRWTDIIFVDDVTEEQEVYGAKVFRWEEVETIRGDVEFVIANGEPYVRETLFYKVKEAGYPFATIINPWAGIGAHTIIEEGCIIFDTGISVGVMIKANSVVNSKGIIGHDAQLGSSVVVGPMAFIGGGASIGDRVYVGPGAMLQDHGVVGNDAIIGLGSVVCRKVADEAIVMGNPAKVVGENTEKKVWGRFG